MKQRDAAKSGETLTPTPAKYDTGIMVGRSATDKKGELREVLHAHKEGSRWSRHALRYRILLWELRRKTMLSARRKHSGCSSEFTLVNLGLTGGKGPVRRPGLTSQALQKFRKGGFSSNSSAPSTASTWSRRTPSSRFSSFVNAADQQSKKMDTMRMRPCHFKRLLNC